MAIGTVSAMLNTPHALCLSEFTTTSAIAASATVITNRDREGGGGAGDGTDLVAGDVGERASVASHRGGEDHEVVHAARQHRADEQPQEAGQVAELRGQQPVR